MGSSESSYGACYVAAGALAAKLSRGEEILSTAPGSSAGVGRVATCPTRRPARMKDWQPYPSTEASMIASILVGYCQTVEWSELAESVLHGLDTASECLRHTAVLMQERGQSRMDEARDVHDQFVVTT